MRNIRSPITLLVRRLVVLLGAATLIIGCSSGDDASSSAPSSTEAASVDDEGAGAASDSATTDPATGPDRVVLVTNAGEEPRVQLSGQAGLESVVTVTAEEHILTTSSSLTEDQTFSGDYDLAVATKDYAGGFKMAVERTVRALTTDTLEAELAEIAGYVHTYSPNGLPDLGRNAQETQYSNATRGLLVTPNMILVVPEEPVGPGAEWTIPLDRLGDLRAQVTAVDITDDLIEAELTFQSSNDQGSFTMTATGTYDRRTLIAVDVTTESIVRVEAEVSNNGELVEVESQHRSTRTYQGASA